MSEIAWTAGLFEGEGSVSLQRGIYPQLTLSLTDKDVLDRFASAVNSIAGTSSVYGPYAWKQTPRKPYWNWRLSRITDVQRVLRAFWPYLGTRRRAKAADVFASYYLADVKRKPVIKEA